jgi:uncharacterized membrane protein
MSPEPDEENQETEKEEENSGVSRTLFLAISIGCILVFIGSIIMVLAIALGSSVSESAGVVIFIGPFPIVFGAGPDGNWLILIGIAIAALSLIMFWVMRRKFSVEEA